MKKVLSIIAAGLLGLSVYAAPEIVRLDSLEAAAYGASYVTIIEYDDFAAFTETNGTHGITSSIPAKVGLTMAGMILETAFNDARGSASTNSMLLTIGDGSDADYFLTSTEVAADSTEVFVQFSPVGAGTIVSTPTLQTVAVTNSAVEDTFPATLVTNLTIASTFTGSRLGQKYYSAAGSVVYTFTGAGGVIPSSLTSGKLKIYWRELK